MTDLATKLFYLAKRNPALNHEQFIRRWRQHGALAMQQKFFGSISRYAHCETLDPPPGVRGSADFDGVGIVWFRDLTPFPPGEYERMREDELETFSEHVSHSVLRCSELVLKPGRGLIKAHVFIVRRPGTTYSDFARHWSEVHGPMMLQYKDLAGQLAGYVQNCVFAEASKESRLEFDGVAEFHFYTREHMQRFFSEMALKTDISADSSEFLDKSRTLFVVTDEVMLYGARDALRAA